MYRSIFAIPHTKNPPTEAIGLSVGGFSILVEYDSNKAAKLKYLAALFWEVFSHDFNIRLRFVVNDIDPHIGLAFVIY